MQIEVFNKSKHDREGFDCGEELLNFYLQNQVSQDVKRKLAVCYVLADDNNKVIGYYTLTNESLDKSDIPDNYKKKIPAKYNVPVTLLGRIAVDKQHKGNGCGAQLLIDALWSCYNASKVIGSMAVIVDPLNGRAESFYNKYGFILLPDSKKMFLPMNTIKKLF